jgi:phosphoenolpyruvate carboxylase
MRHQEDLASELRSLVKRSVALLGAVIQEEAGAAAYARIEAIRQQMTRVRGSSYEQAYELLRRELEGMRRLKAPQRLEIALSFTLMLELMNACENAYRTWRLRSSPRLKVTRKPRAIIYVLTAHPTESRSPETIALFHEIQRALVAWLEDARSAEAEARVRNLLVLSWRLSPSRSRKPSVRDEAESIDSMVLRNETLGAVLDANRELAPVYLRTWVGGDKDGHPGVDESTLQQSLDASRGPLLRWFENGLDRVHTLSVRIRDPQLERELKSVRKELAALKRVKPGDGGRVARLRERLKELKDIHPAISDLRLLLRVFPGLVIPLELRESSDLLMEAARGKPMAISRMVKRVAQVSRGGDPKWYARGLIISMASELEHLQAAARVVKKQMGALRLPVIPLFEQNEALKKAPALAQAMLDDRELREAMLKHWGKNLEVMVGYSDSAKETGVLRSRLSIARSVHELDQLYRRKQSAEVSFRPVFFHGSGGSTDRGGGSIDEQTAWWPESALDVYKATIQGETIERSVASPEITRRRLDQIAHRVGAQRPDGSKPYQPSHELERFADLVAERYRARIREPEFLDIVSRATGYRYLTDLRLGSRPAKRGKVLSVQALRAIPWVMCWTQTRVLFPTWWGVGSAWKALSSQERRGLEAELRTDPLFGSFVKVLAATLARVELPVFQLYLENSGLDRDVARRAIEDFRREYGLAVAFVREITGERDLLWFKPWLGTSIQLRSPMIHPLNLVQILTLRERNPALVRVTATGIASGMLTTG